MKLLIGTSGWQYDDWRGDFYPTSVPKSRWLEQYSASFATVESNSSFYRLPAQETFGAWARRTPDDFVMAVKMSRFLTHVLRLRSPSEPVERLLHRASALGCKLGPVLVQLPPTSTYDPEALTAALDCFPATVRVAFEPRHASWFCDGTFGILEERNVALCAADNGGVVNGGVVNGLRATAEWGYVRLHRGDSARPPSYRREALQAWCDRTAATWPESAEVFVYFNNDPGCAAPYDASRLAAEARSRGIECTRAPEPGTLHGPCAPAEPVQGSR
ncbi:MAG: DUF72 domain-containing protein [Actinomycetota bacterium]|nr:DUF72 domain-containing protein [Actinomycetota bacterium]